VRYQARLDAETQATLEDLAKTLHRKRGEILRHVMQWGLTHGDAWTIDRSSPASMHLVPVLLEPTLQQQVQDAAAAHGVTAAAWLRQALRQVTIGDFPDSWRAGETTPRSHDSGYYGTRFMLRLDETTISKLQHLVEHFDKPRAEVIRQLIVQATPEAFPQSWQLAVKERRQRHGRVRDVWVYVRWSGRRHELPPAVSCSGRLSERVAYVKMRATPAQHRRPNVAQRPAESTTKQRDLRPSGGIMRTYPVLAIGEGSETVVP
jgi:predicted transcriptional regulator